MSETLVEKYLEESEDNRILLWREAVRYWRYDMGVSKKKAEEHADQALRSYGYEPERT